MLSENSVLNPKATFQLRYNNSQAKRDIWPRSHMPGGPHLLFFLLLVNHPGGGK